MSFVCGLSLESWCYVTYRKISFKRYVMIRNIQKQLCDSMLCFYEIFNRRYHLNYCTTSEKLEKPGWFSVYKAVFWKTKKILFTSSFMCLVLYSGADKGEKCRILFHEWLIYYKIKCISFIYTYNDKYLTSICSNKVD